MNFSTPRNIIVRMPNWIGDIVMATPIITDLKNQWPEASITAMCPAHLSDILLGHPDLSEIFSFTIPNEFLRQQKRRHIIQRLRQGTYDLGIVLPNSFSSAWWFWRGHIKRRIGFKRDFRCPLLTDVVPFPKERGQEHLVKTYKHLLSPLGIPLSDTAPLLHVTSEEKSAIKALLTQYNIPETGKVIGINPGAAYGSAKCWPPDRFRSVTEKLLENPNHYILYFGDKAGSDLVNTICEELPARVTNLAGHTNLRELIGFIEACDLFLTNDSGPMHIAAALKTPLLALFGSTNEIATGPYEHGQIIHKHVPCSPCYKRTCPIDFPCMTGISAEEVYDSLMKMLYP